MRTISGKPIGASRLGSVKRLWAATGLGPLIRTRAAYVASARFEFKSLTIIGAGVAALYVMALINPAEPHFRAGGTSASIASQKAAIFGPTPESLTSFIIEKTALGDGTGSRSVASLVNLYQDVDYRLDDIKLGEMTVPRILVDKVPDDMVTVESPAKRKQLFIKLALPLILYSNERIAADRDKLITISNKLERTSASAREQEWLDNLAARYGLEMPDLDALLQRVDVIPPSLALAQGAEESGWGTSRFVREGNAIFGQRTFDKGAGLVPTRREADARHEVKSFNGLMDSVASYMTNLNTHDAYVEFRRIRAGQRAEGDVDSHSLVGTLNRYSERGEDYIKTIRSIIDRNDLRSYDGASFGKFAAGDSKI